MSLSTMHWLKLFYYFVNIIQYFDHKCASRLMLELDKTLRFSCNNRFNVFFSIILHHWNRVLNQYFNNNDCFAGNFKAGPEPGTILKKLCPKEQLCFQVLMKDVLRPFVPEYKGHLTTDDGDRILCIKNDKPILV